VSVVPFWTLTLDYADPFNRGTAVTALSARSSTLRATVLVRIVKVKSPLALVSARAVTLPTDPIHARPDAAAYDSRRHRPRALASRSSAACAACAFCSACASPRRQPPSNPHVPPISSLWITRGAAHTEHCCTRV